MWGFFKKSFVNLGAVPVSLSCPLPTNFESGLPKYSEAWPGEHWARHHIRKCIIQEAPRLPPAKASVVLGGAKASPSLLWKGRPEWSLAVPGLGRLCLGLPGLMFWPSNSGSGDCLPGLRH